MMKLVTQELEKLLPPLYSTEHSDNVMVWTKFFTPWSHWSWYPIEYDPQQRLFFGYVEGDCNELGFFSLDELEKLRGPVGLTIERDLYFKPCLLSKIQKAEVR